MGIAQNSLVWVSYKFLVGNAHPTVIIVHLLNCQVGIAQNSRVGKLQVFGRQCPPYGYYCPVWTNYVKAREIEGERV
ncbi:MAG: hypothetical protein AB4426_09565 [Xenococcaceae cyanobacterium]